MQEQSEVKFSTPAGDAVKSLSGTIWKLGNKSKGVLGSITDLNEQIDCAIKAMPKFT